MSTPTTGSSTEASPTPPSEDRPEEQTEHGPSGQAALLRLAQAAFPLRVGQPYTLRDASLPWGRSFEWDFDLKAN